MNVITSYSIGCSAMTQLKFFKYVSDNQWVLCLSYQDEFNTHSALNLL